MLNVMRAVLAMAFALGPGLSSAATITYTDETTFLSATTSLTLDGFESGAWDPGGAQAQPLVHLGNTWTGANDLHNGVQASFVRTGSNALTSSDGRTTDSADLIEVVFGAPTTAVGVWILTTNTLVRLEAFDAGNTLLGSIDMGIANVYTFRGITTTTDIASVRISSVLAPSNDDFVIDDFVFGDAASVPAPPAAALLATGLAALAAHRRRA